MQADRIDRPLDPGEAFFFLADRSSCMNFVLFAERRGHLDAERIRATGVPAIQINTGKGCHLDAHMLGHALHQLSPVDDSLLMIENVGNLVCPAAFDLGEAHKVVILSVTEGEDKPLKYPNMFHAASLMLVNKIDLLPYVSFDGDLAISYARQVNPALQVIQVSATTGAQHNSAARASKANLPGKIITVFPFPGGPTRCGRDLHAGKSGAA